MKKVAGLLLILIAFSSCEEKDCCVNLEPVTATIKFTHNWDGTAITSSDFNQFKFTNAHGETLSIERLRYLVSNIYLGNSENQNNKVYHLVNIGENSGLEFTLENIPLGTHQLKFTFGFTDADNTDGIYQDLNSASFNVPGMLGGGYHYMQFDGKYLDTNNAEANFNYHVIRAVDRTDPDNLIFEDTSFLVDLGNITLTDDATIEIKMNVAEWFKNPNTWNLNELNTVLMPNFEAQKMMSANGKSVFSLGEVSQ
ncbi:MAG: MbnP family protein [Polaribacter sp.]